MESQTKLVPNMEYNLIHQATALCEQLKINTVFVVTTAQHIVDHVLKQKKWDHLFWVCCGLDAQSDTNKQPTRKSVKKLYLPEMGSEDALKLSSFHGVIQEVINPEEAFLALYNHEGESCIDTIRVTKAKLSWPFLNQVSGSLLQRVFLQKVLPQVLTIALRFSLEGREGKSIGTCFVIGEIETLEKHTEQLIFNPCQGHPRRLRNIFNMDYFETLREFAALDGAFLINEKGVVESAGVYLSTKSAGDSFQSGLGARHAAACSITKSVDCIAVVISESSSEINVYQGGGSVLQLKGGNSHGAFITNQG